MINRALLTGRLTRDVDLRYTPSGAAVGNLRWLLIGNLPIKTTSVKQISSTV